MFNLNKKIIFLAGCLLLSLLGASQALAARLVLSPKSQSAGGQEWFYIDLFLDPEDQPINALEGRLVFDSNLLQAYAVSNGNSIVSLWTEQPQIKDDGSIIFSGIIPGGYSDKNGLILSAIFKAKQTGSSQLKLSEARVLLNDGQGTAAALTTEALNLQLQTSTTTSSFQPPVFDQIPPESFQPIISASPELFANQYFLAFATQDKNSGLAYYEVLESHQPLSASELKTGPWPRAESPYLLKDQKLTSYVYVRAIDRGGNARLAEVKPTNLTFSQKLLTNKKIFAIIIAITTVIIFGCLGFILSLRKKQHEGGNRRTGSTRGQARK